MIRTPQRYTNPQRESAKARMQNTIPRAIANTQMFSQKYRNLELGIETTPVVDTRSNAELLQDKMFLQQQIRPMLQGLFGSDAKESDEFLAYLSANNINVNQLRDIYPDLLRLGRPVLAKDVIIKAGVLLAKDQAITSAMSSMSQQRQQQQQQKQQPAKILPESDEEEEDVEEKEDVEYEEEVDEMKRQDIIDEIDEIIAQVKLIHKNKETRLTNSDAIRIRNYLPRLQQSVQRSRSSTELDNLEKMIISVRKSTAPGPFIKNVVSLLEQIYPDFRQPKKAPKKAAPVDEPKADEPKERLPPTVLEQLKMGRGVKRVRPPRKYK